MPICCRAGEEDAAAAMKLWSIESRPHLGTDFHFDGREKPLPLPRARKCSSEKVELLLLLQRQQRQSS